MSNLISLLENITAHCAVIRVKAVTKLCRLSSAHGEEKVLPAVQVLSFPVDLNICDPSGLGSIPVYAAHPRLVAAAHAHVAAVGDLVCGPEITPPVITPIVVDVVYLSRDAASHVEVGHPVEKPGVVVYIGRKVSGFSDRACRSIKPYVRKDTSLWAIPNQVFEFLLCYIFRHADLRNEPNYGASV